MNILIEPPQTMWDLKWSMFGIPVRVHPMFWLMGMVLSYHEKIPFGYVAVGVGCIFLSILVHEFGHALSSIYYGDRHPRVVLYQMGGLCISGDKELHRWPRISMLLWGPGAGYVLAAIVYVVGGILCGWEWVFDKYTAPINPYVDSALHQFLWINVIWGTVNLAPVFPLDGGQITRELIGWKWPRRGDRLAFSISFYTAVFLAFAAVGLSQIYPAFLFGWLAYSSWTLRKQIELYGELGGGEDSAPRQPWEQDADWWKK